MGETTRRARALLLGLVALGWSLVPSFAPAQFVESFVPSEVVHGGSAGFFNVSELVGGPLASVQDSGLAYTDRETVTSLVNGEIDVPGLVTVGNRSGVRDASILTEVVIEQLVVDSMGGLSGIATMVVRDAIDDRVLVHARSVLVTGRMRFNETWRRTFPTGDTTSIDGILDRRANHQLRLSGRGRTVDGTMFRFDISARARTNPRMPMTNRFDMEPFIGRLTTSVSRWGSGRSDVVITGLRDEAGYWEIDTENFYATNRNDSRWEARTRFFSPFLRNVDGDIIPIEDVGRLSTNWYNASRDRIGSYNIDYRARINRANYRLRQKGYLTALREVEGAAIRQQIDDGVPVSLMPLFSRFFDRNFRMTCPAARTTIRTDRDPTDLRPPGES